MSPDVMADNAGQADASSEFARSLLAGAISSAQANVPSASTTFARRDDIERPRDRSRSRSNGRNRERRSRSRSPYRRRDSPEKWTGGNSAWHDRADSRWQERGGRRRSRSPDERPARYERHGYDNSRRDIDDDVSNRRHANTSNDDHDRRARYDDRATRRRSPPRGPGKWRGDWLCTCVACATHNYARRDDCFSCNAPRYIAGCPLEASTENNAIAGRGLAAGFVVGPAVAVPTVLAKTGGYSATGQPYIMKHPYAYDTGTIRSAGASLVAGVPGSDVFTRIASRVLVVRGMSDAVKESDVFRAFRDFGAVETVHAGQMLPLAALLEGLDMTPYTVAAEETDIPGASFFFLSFYTVDDATRALRFCADWQSNRERLDNVNSGIGCITIQGELCEVTYAREDCIQLDSALLHNQLTLAQQHATFLTDPSRGIAAARAEMAPAGRLPLNFDTHGGYYVFDAASGLFLERSRQFWYDPASKCYLDALQWQYYRWDSSSLSFVRWTPPPPDGPAPAPMQTIVPDTALQAPNAAQISATAPLGSVSGNTNVLLAKWKKARSDMAPKSSAAAAKSGFFEVEEESSGTTVSAGPRETGAAPVTGQLTQSPKQSLLTTSLGDLLPFALPVAPVAHKQDAAKPTPGPAPIAAACKLCQRGFQSYETLRKHIDKSDLHKKNLELLTNGELHLPDGITMDMVQNPPPPGSEAPASAVHAALEKPGARDRAAERRKIIGSGVFERPMSSQPPAPLPSAADTLAAAAETPIDTTNNMGASLLAKMGWKQGKGLGKHDQGIVAPINAAGISDGSHKGLGSEDMGDWQYLQRR